MATEATETTTTLILDLATIDNDTLQSTIDLLNSILCKRKPVPDAVVVNSLAMKLKEKVFTNYNYVEGGVLCTLQVGEYIKLAYHPEKKKALVLAAGRMRPLLEEVISNR